MIKKSLAIALVVFFVFSFAAQVSAEKVVAKLGGSRMVLRLAPGESERKSVNVINDNTKDIQIDITVAGDLANNVELEEESFVLKAGQQKKAYFKIKAPQEAGTTETKINVKFTPDEGNGVGLSATVVVIVSEDGEPVDDLVYDDSSIDEDSSDGFSLSSNANSVDDSSTGKKLSTSSILVISTGILVLVLAVLAVFAFKVKKKKGSGRPRE